MKRVLRLITTLFSIFIILSSCISDKADTGFIKINETSFTLTFGLVEDYGTNNDISYRNYWIRLQSSMGDQPVHFIVFNLYSTSTVKIGEGTYTYKISPNQGGEFTWVKVGYNIQYDDAGVKVAGTILLDSDVDVGTIVITNQGDYNKIEFDIVIKKNSVTYTVKGEFKDILHEGDVYYSDIKK